MNQHERLAAMREAIALLDRVVTANSTAPFDDVLVSAPMNTWRIGRIGHKDWADAVGRYADGYSEGGRYL